MNMNMNMVKYITIILVVFSVILILFAILSPWILTKILMKNIFLIENLNNTKVIGNTIAATTAPFIGLAGIITTFLAFFVQYVFNNIQVNQMFESTLFNLIGIHDNIRDNLLQKKNENQCNIFQDFLHEIETDFKNLEKKFDKINDNLKLEILQASYQINYFDTLSLDEKIPDEHYKIYKEYYDNKIKIRGKEKHRYLFSNYFASLFSIFFYIKETSSIKNQEKNTKSIKDKSYYANILINTLTVDEILVLYYHCLSGIDEVWVDLKLVSSFKILSKLPLSLALYNPEFGIHIISNEKIKAEDYFYYLKKYHNRS